VHKITYFQPWQPKYKLVTAEVCEHSQTVLVTYFSFKANKKNWLSNVFYVIVLHKQCPFIAKHSKWQISDQITSKTSRQLHLSQLSINQLLWDHFQVYTVSQKKNICNIIHCNFAKYWPIFTILSLMDSARNLQQNCC